MANFGQHVSASLQGTEEFSSVLNTPDIVTSPLTGLPDAYARVFQFVGGSSREGLTWARDAVNQTAPSANHIIPSFYIRFSDLSPTTEFRFFASTGAATEDVTAGRSLNLILESGGDVRVEDNSASTISTITTPFTVNTWHKVDVRILPHPTTSGEVQIWVDDQEVLSNQTGLSVSGYGFHDHFAVGGSPTSSEEVYFAAGSAIVNSSSVDDRIDGDFEIVGPYSVGQTGAAPDDDGGGTGGGGDSLDGDGALWETTAEIPFSDETPDTDAAEYAGTPLDGSCYCDGGTRGGPSGDSNVDGDSNIKSAQYTFRAERGNGGGTTHAFYFGNSADSAGAAGLYNPTLDGPTTFTFISEDAAVMPLSTEYARMGFGVVGGRNIYMHEMVCTLLHVPAAADGDKTVSPGAGALTLEGFAPTVTNPDPKLAEPAAAALVLGGFAPTLVETDNKIVQPGEAALSLAGFAPTLIETDNKLVQPAAGALALEGFVPTLDLTLDLVNQPGAGALTLTGFAPTIDVSADQIAAPDAAALSLTGFVPTLVKTDNKLVAPAQADLALTGFAPTLDLTLDLVVQPDKADLALTGFAPVVDVAADKTVAPGAGALALEGFAPTLDLTLDLVVQPDVAVLALEGFAPTITVPADHTALPAAAALAIEGFAPTLVETDNKIVQPNQADLALEGFAPTLAQTDDHLIEVPVAALALEGFIPAVTSGGDKTVQVPAGALTITGNVPVVLLTNNHVVQPGKADLALAGFAPVLTLTADILVSVPDAALALTGFAPTLDLTGNHVIQVPAASLQLSTFAPTLDLPGSAVSLAKHTQPMLVGLKHMMGM